MIRTDATQLLFHLLSAWVAGSLIGLERSYHGRPAGFRTHALVCVSSAFLMQVMVTQWEWIGPVPLETIRTDPTRMAQGIMTGIGFLGAGVIFKEGATVRGLTTAASIWITAALGILFGVGRPAPAFLGTVVALLTLALFRHVEYRMPRQFYARYLVRYPKEKVPPEAEVRRVASAHGFTVSNLSYRLAGNGADFEYRMVIRTRDRGNVSRLAEHLRKEEGILEFLVEPSVD